MGIHFFPQYPQDIFRGSGNFFDFIRYEQFKSRAGLGNFYRYTRVQALNAHALAFRLKIHNTQLGDTGYRPQSGQACFFAAVSAI